MPGYGADRFPCMTVIPWKYFLRKSPVNKLPLLSFLLQHCESHETLLRVECFSEAYHKLNMKYWNWLNKISISCNILLNIRATKIKKKRFLPFWKLTCLERTTETEILLLDTCDKTFDAIIHQGLGKCLTLSYQRAGSRGGLYIRYTLPGIGKL